MGIDKGVYIDEWIGKYEVFGMDTEMGMYRHRIKDVKRKRKCLGGNCFQGCIKE